jgi:hypothetical protein
MPAGFRSIGTAFIAAAIVSGSGFGQGSQPIKTTVCELNGDPERFSHKLVEFRSEFISRFEWEGFVDESCSAKIQASAYGIYDDLSAQDGHPHLPVYPRQDHNYRVFRKYADTKFKWLDGGRCQDCPLYRVSVTASGRFDYFSGKAVVARPTVGERPVGSSAGDLPLLRFAVQSVWDVRATPIDPSIYSAKKRRDLTLEEAHELVKAFQKDNGVGGYALEKYEVNEYPGFQFFQAVPDPPRGPIHYAVDRNTGEVWNATFCEQVSSPRLVTLQVAIRNRIGLTRSEYQNVRRQGPRCEHGMPRAGGQ